MQSVIPQVKEAKVMQMLSLIGLLQVVVVLQEQPKVMVIVFIVVLKLEDSSCFYSVFIILNNTECARRKKLKLTNISFVNSSLETIVLNVTR
jgi:hypothetical protein